MECLNEKSRGPAAQVEELRAEWKRLWRERLDDRVRAEGVANEDYSSLFIERGTVILATRDFKLLSFKGILEERGIGAVYKFVSPSPGIGGWGKFIRNSVQRGRSSGGVHGPARYFPQEAKKPQQLRKGGRGWLHL